MTFTKVKEKLDRVTKNIYSKINKKTLMCRFNISDWMIDRGQPSVFVSYSDCIVGVDITEINKDWDAGKLEQFILERYIKATDSLLEALENARTT